MNVDRFVGGGQLKTAGDIAPQFVEFLDETMPLGHVEVGENDQLAANDLRTVRQNGNVFTQCAGENAR